SAPAERKKWVGILVNDLASNIEREVKDRHESLELYELFRGELGTEVAPHISEKARSLRQRILESERIDITLPGIVRPLGAEHPVIKTMNEIVGVFRAMGYSVAEGPEIETDYYNFEALNFPPDHPARDTQDTLFVAGQEKKPQRDRLLLRTHTSPVQIHAMEKQPPPIRVVVPG